MNFLDQLGDLLLLFQVESTLVYTVSNDGLTQLTTAQMVQQLLLPSKPDQCLLLKPKKSMASQLVNKVNEFFS